MLRKIRKMKGNANCMVPAVEQHRKNEDVRVIAITSGKGGVGKTNIAANLAYILSKMGKKTLLLDADAGLANVDVILGVTPKYNLYHVLQGHKTLAEVIVEGPGGMKILPAASGIMEMADLSKGHKFTILEEINEYEENLDFVLIDTAAGITGNVLYFNLVAKEIIVIVTPEPTSLTDAYALIKVLYQNYAAKRFMLLINMAKDAAEAKGVYRRLSNAAGHFLNLAIEYLGYIAYDEKLREAVRMQDVLAQAFPYSKASKCIAASAKRLCEEQPGKYENGALKLFGKVTIGKND